MDSGSNGNPPPAFPSEGESIRRTAYQRLGRVTHAWDADAIGAATPLSPGAGCFELLAVLAGAAPAAGRASAPSVCRGILYQSTVIGLATRGIMMIESCRVIVPTEK